MRRFLLMVKEHPATSATAILTAVVGFPALLVPAMTTAMQQDPAAVADGQPWRLITPLVVQGYGVGQYLFNLLGVVLVGVAVERRYGWGRWVGLYLLAGVAAIIATSFLFPQVTDSGASAAVAGLIGALAVDTLRTRVLPGWAAYLYSAFFIVYLTALALGGAVSGAVAGSIILPALIVSRVFAPRAVLRWVHPLIVIVGTLLLIARGDAHGIGALVGLLFALSWGQGSASRKGIARSEVNRAPQ